MPFYSHRITRITLTDYRNYTSLRLDPPPGLLALCGANGAGKTNLLEAISLLTPGRGLRGASFETIGRHGRTGDNSGDNTNGDAAWAVSATSSDHSGERQLGTAWRASAADGISSARAVMVDGQEQKSSGALAGLLRLVWLTPALDRLFSGAASERRRYLDRMVALFDGEQGARLNRFEKLMRERNLLLAAGSYDQAWVSSLEMQMAEEAVAIAAARLQSVSNLGAYLTTERLSGHFPWSQLSLNGEIEDMVAKLPAVEAEERYRQLLRQGRGADRAAGRTLVGPHRSDLVVRHGPKNIGAEEGSTGEQKALLIGLILAQTQAIRAVTGSAPVLLLDEIAAHLDKTRRSALFAHLEQLQVQAWMTGTEAELFDGASASAVVYHIENGRLNESNSF
jgi:DNA replication and repair protein RecF